MKLQLNTKKSNSYKMEQPIHDTVLLRIHRQYSKDEAMKALFSEISFLKFRIGELASENEELKAIIAGNVERKTAKHWKKDEYVAELRRNLKDMHKIRLEFKKNYVEYRDKYYSLLAKLKMMEGK